MAFPPNYRMDRSARDRAKQEKNERKQNERDERRLQKKQDQSSPESAGMPAMVAALETSAEGETE